MGLENFTTYTEVDEDSDITITANKIAVDTIRRDAISYVRKDRGVGHFGDFEHLIKGTCISANEYHNTGFWALTNGYTTIKQMTTNSSGISLSFRTGDEETNQIYLSDYTVEGTDIFIFEFDTLYYCTIQRSGTSLTCKIYSDANRTILLDTLSLVCSITTYRYIYGLASYGEETFPAQQITLNSEDLDLQETSTKYTTNKTSQESGYKNRTSQESGYKNRTSQESGYKSKTLQE